MKTFKDPSRYVVRGKTSIQDWWRAILEAAFVVRVHIKSKAVVDAGYAVRGTQKDINSRWKAERSTLLKYKLIN
mgnify:CR=1 FL=1